MTQGMTRRVVPPCEKASSVTVPGGAVHVAIAAAGVLRARRSSWQAACGTLASRQPAVEAAIETDHREPTATPP